MGETGNAQSSRVVDDDPRATLDRVRQAENEIGNSLGVVLAWLRLQADRPGGLDGAQVAIRRLEDAQTAVSSLLRDMAAGAVLRAARDPHVASTLFPGAAAEGRIGDDVVLVNATYLAQFVDRMGSALASDPVVLDRALLLDVLEPGRLGTEELALLQASGGELVMRGSTPSASWPLASPDDA